MQPNTNLTAAEARSLAHDAYVFGLPLVYFSVQQDIMTNVAKPEAGRAPLNQFAHFREFPDAGNRLVVAFNVDTLYSIASINLSGEPIILSIPDMGSRWWLMQVLDAWDEVPAAPGTRTEGNQGGHFALVGPGWRKRLPPGLKELRVDTSLCALAGRTYTSGPADYSAVHKIQDRYKLTPLSKWGSNYKPPTQVPVRIGVDARTPVGVQVFKLTAGQFFNRLCDLMVNNPPRDADGPIMSRFARLGIKPGAKFTTETFDSVVRRAIDEGTGSAQKAILDQEGKMGKEINGWVIALDSGRYGTDYLNRAAWTYFAIGANLPEDAVYPNTTKDSDGKQLSGRNKYVLRFSKDQLPPAEDFWSLTLYDKDGYLVDNPIHRHSRGDRDNFMLEEDGSLTVYIQSESPGRTREENWLPSPKDGPFKLYLRLYGPKKEVKTGEWAPPAADRAA